MYPVPRLKVSWDTESPFYIVSMRERIKVEGYSDHFSYGWLVLSAFDSN
jgi:hypothetical protein